MPFTEEQEIEGYAKFEAEIKALAADKSKHPLFILFTGSDGADGKSWCPDCIEFEGAWEKLRKSFTPEEGTFLRVKVGPRADWKDADCPFRTDKNTRLQSIPTLVQWGTPKRLSDNAILNPENIKMLMEDD